MPGKLGQAPRLPAVTLRQGGRSHSALKMQDRLVRARQNPLAQGCRSSPFILWASSPWECEELWRPLRETCLPRPTLSPVGGPRPCTRPSFLPSLLSTRHGTKTSHKGEMVTVC